MSTAAEARPGFVGTIHATCIVLGERAVLIRGASGSGKSTLARALLAEAAAQGRFARLVADDRVQVSGSAGRLVARSVQATEGLIEARGIGLLRVPSEAAAVVGLVVNCRTGHGPRLPEPDTEVLCGVRLPCLDYADDACVRLFLWQLELSHDRFVTGS